MFKKPQRVVRKIFIHCSASDNPDHDDIMVIKEWHLKRGFDNVGYHYFINKTGTIQEGRILELVPAAQRGHNTGSIAICLHGLEKDKFTAEQFASLYNLCREINQVYEGKVTFHGHCEVDPNKPCPVFDYKTLLCLNEKGEMMI